VEGGGEYELLCDPRLSGAPAPQNRVAPAGARWFFQGV